MEPFQNILNLLRKPISNDGFFLDGDRRCLRDFNGRIVSCVSGNLIFLSEDAAGNDSTALMYNWFSDLLVRNVQKIELVPEEFCPSTDLASSSSSSNPIVFKEQALKILAKADNPSSLCSSKQEKGVDKSSEQPITDERRLVLLEKYFCMEFNFLGLDMELNNEHLQSILTKFEGDFSIYSKQPRFKLRVAQCSFDRLSEKQFVAFIIERINSWQYAVAYSRLEYKKKSSSLQLSSIEDLVTFIKKYETQEEFLMSSILSLRAKHNNIGSAASVVYRGADKHELDKIKQVKLGLRAFSLLTVNYSRALLGPGYYCSPTLRIAESYAGINIKDRVISVISTRFDSLSMFGFDIELESDVFNSDSKPKKKICPEIGLLRSSMRSQNIKGLKSGEQFYVITNPLYVRSIKGYVKGCSAKIHIPFTLEEVDQHGLTPRHSGLDGGLTGNGSRKFSAKVTDVKVKENKASKLEIYEVKAANGELKYFIKRGSEEIRVKPTLDSIYSDTQFDSCTFAVQYMLPGKQSFAAAG